MITENRWLHILGVARKAKEFASKMRPDDEHYAEDMFLLGLLHDLGYEFAETGQDHALIGGKILKRSGYRYWQEVAGHGKPEAADMTDELFILNCADMSVRADGKNCTMSERLKDIASRYGIASPAYRKTVSEINRLLSDPRWAKLSS